MLDSVLRTGFMTCIAELVLLRIRMTSTELSNNWRQPASTCESAPGSHSICKRGKMPAL